MAAPGQRRGAVVAVAANWTIRSPARRTRCSGTQPASRALWLARRGVTDACAMGGVTRKPGWLDAGALDAGRWTWSAQVVLRWCPACSFISMTSPFLHCVNGCVKEAHEGQRPGLLRLWPKAT